MLSQQFLPGIFLGALFAIRATALAYDCAEKRCAEMSTCAEAHYKFTVCGQSKRDGDNDGIPCENVCGDTMETYRARLKAEGIELAPPATAEPKAIEHGIAPGAKQSAPSPPSTSFTCAGKRRCAEMVSCEEARFYLTACGVSSLDRDHDGVPCEALCGVR